MSETKRQTNISLTVRHEKKHFEYYADFIWLLPFNFN